MEESRDIYKGLNRDTKTRLNDLCYRNIAPSIQQSLVFLFSPLSRNYIQDNQTNGLYDSALCGDYMRGVLRFRISADSDGLGWARFVINRCLLYSE